ncbi:MAG: Quinoprotein glucose dehydrogenase precursor, partial [Verrucomicrobiota bacterium]
MSVLHRVLWSALPSLALLVRGPSAHAADIAAAPGGTSTNGFRALVTADRTSAPLLAPASREGEIRLKQFKHAPELKVDLWAAEPMLANPVAFSIDEKGRVFTSETYRYRSSVLDIRHYMFMLEDDLASRSIEDRLATIRKWFGPDGERALSTETEVVRLIEDTNGDGVADKSRVFADGFTSPLSGIASGVLARNGEVWVTEIPSLWRFRPANASEAATMARDKTSLTINHTPYAKDPALHSLPHVLDRTLVAEQLLRGFGVRFSFTGHDLHGLKFGPDGRLYFSVGDRGTHVTTREGTVIDLPDEGAVFRCEPDGSKLEVVHRGLRNPQELAFNEYGDLFTGDNDSDQGDRERWVQVIEGADSGWRVGHQHAPLGNAGMWNMERLWVPQFEGQAAYILPPIANIGDGPSGLVFDATHRYGKPGASTSASAPATFLLSYFKGTSAKSGLYALTVEPRGASYALVGHDEFLWNALVPDVDLAPDGSVFFADWHEGWPKSNKGRLYRASLPAAVGDPVLKQTATLLGEGMTNRTEKALLELLAFPDMRVRQEAQFELAARGPKSFDGLRKVAFESKNRLARIHAIWGMGQLARLSPITELAAELESTVVLTADPDPEIRRQSVRLLGTGKVVRAYRAIVGCITDTDPGVAQAALLTMPRIWRNGFKGRYAAGSFEAIV